MATGQVLLDTMEVLHPELQLQSGEADVTKGLVLLNRAQDAFEMRVAQYPNVRGSATGTVVTAASTETTAYPAGLLRVDALYFIDPNTSRPAYPLQRIQEIGGHAWSRFWPWNVVSTTTTGRPRAYWTNGTNFYWDPLPNAVHTVRYYGFSAVADISAGGTFAYPDFAILPLAIFAVKIHKVGLDDPSGDLTGLARDVFDPTVQLMSNFQRDSADHYAYRYSHST